MSKLSVVVELDVDAATRDAFHSMLCEHAATSLAEDDGCERFDVMIPNKSTDKVMIYEIWQSRQALEVHAKSDHTARYQASTTGMVKNRKLTLCALNEGGVR